MTQMTITFAELDRVVFGRETVKIKDSAARHAGQHVRAMGWNFYGPAVNVKIGFLEDDGSYSGDWDKVPAEWIEVL